MEFRVPRGARLVPGQFGGLDPQCGHRGRLGSIRHFWQTKTQSLGLLAIKTRRKMKLHHAAIFWIPRSGHNR